MGANMFGKTSERLEAVEIARRHLIAKRHSCTFDYVHQPDGSYHAWFEGPDLGSPENKEYEAEVLADLARGGEEAGLSGFQVLVRGDLEIGGRVSVLQIDETLEDSDWPTNYVIARAAGVRSVLFVDAGDHPTYRESVYRILEVL